jgi:mannose-6-phosphate isomerase-like protein (cupin superfamily)
MLAMQAYFTHYGGKMSQLPHAFTKITGKWHRIHRTDWIDMHPDKVNLVERFAHFSEHWSPKIVGELNDSYVKLVKFQGEFVWHHHENEDELFLVVKGQMLMRFRERDVWVNEGEFIIVPRGVEHMPLAPEECQVVLLEPRTTLNTGNVENERTVAQLERI